MINRKLITFLLTILLIVEIPFYGASVYGAEDLTGDYDQINVIVGFKTGIVSTQDAKNYSIKSLGGQIHKELKMINAVSATMSAKEASELASNPLVAYVEPDYPVHTLEQVVPWGIEKTFGEDYPFAAWEAASGAGIKVAVLDTGISSGHVDLPSLAGGMSIFEENYGIDVKGHGTHVAGIISAKDNSIGVAGVSPVISLYSEKVLDDSGNGSTSGIIQGIEWAITNDMDIINMSLGTNSYSEALETACNSAYSAGILLVAAAGNDGAAVIYPAKFDSVLAISASDSNNSIASFSNIGSEVDLIAPGVDILSTVPGNGGTLSIGGITYYATALEGSAIGTPAAVVVDCGTASDEGTVQEALSYAGITLDQDWIALIDRNNVQSFSSKVRNVMTFGAIGAVIINNDDTSPNDAGEFSLYAENEDRTFPWVSVVSVSKNNGVSIRAISFIESSLPLGEMTTMSNSAYKYNSGTSMAAPHVAGAAALLWSANPSLTNGAIRALLLENTQDLGLTSIQQGSGLVRVDLALDALYATYPPEDRITLHLTDFTASSKIYDGTTNAITGAGFSNDSSGAALEFTYNAAFSDKEVGVAKTVNFTNIKISGGDDRYKYVLDQTTGAGIATISQAALTVKASNMTKEIGKSDPSFTVTYAGFVLTENAVNLGGNLHFERAEGDEIGSYIITPSGLTSTNYAIHYDTGILTITEAAPIAPPAVGGGGGMAMPAEVIIPVVTTPAATSTQITLTLSIGQMNLYQTSGAALVTMRAMDAAPILYQDRTLLPIRFIVEALGGTIEWNQPDAKVTIKKGDTVVELWIGNNLAKINGVPTFIDTDNANVMPIIITPGRTMLPIRFIAEALGCSVDWNQEKQEVTVIGEVMNQ